MGNPRIQGLLVPNRGLYRVRRSVPVDSATPMINPGGNPTSGITNATMNAAGVGETQQGGFSFWFYGNGSQPALASGTRTTLNSAVSLMGNLHALIHAMVSANGSPQSIAVANSVWASAYTTYIQAVASPSYPTTGGVTWSVLNECSQATMAAAFTATLAADLLSRCYDNTHSATIPAPALFANDGLAFPNWIVMMTLELYDNGHVGEAIDFYNNAFQDEAPPNTYLPDWPLTTNNIATWRARSMVDDAVNDNGVLQYFNAIVGGGKYDVFDAHWYGRHELLPQALEWLSGKLASFGKSGVKVQLWENGYQADVGHYNATFNGKKTFKALVQELASYGYDGRNLVQRYAYSPYWDKVAGNNTDPHAAADFQTTGPTLRDAGKAVKTLWNLISHNTTKVQELIAPNYAHIYKITAGSTYYAMWADTGYSIPVTLAKMGITNASAIHDYLGNTVAYVDPITLTDAPIIIG